MNQTNLFIPVKLNPILAIPEKFNEYGYTDLMRATEYDDNKKAKSLLEAKCDPFLRNKNNNSAFFIALSNVNSYLTREFIKTREQVPEITEFLTENERKDKELFYFLAWCMGEKSSSKLKEALGLETNDLRASCFSLSTQACEILGGDPSDLFET